MKATIKASVGEIANSGHEYEHFYDLFRDRAYDVLVEGGTVFDEDAYLNVTDYCVVGVESGSILVIEVEIECE